MLYIGEEVGSGIGPEALILLLILARARTSAPMPRMVPWLFWPRAREGSSMPLISMNKLAAPPRPKAKSIFESRPQENLQILSECLGLGMDELVIVCMDRARHKGLIAEIERLAHG